MLLFKNDWFKKYPGAIADVESTNESWVRLAALYKSMGIENAFFHLTLLQPELQGIDPHDTKLSEDIRAKILMECTYNPWYFFREVVRIPSGNSPLKFKANRGIIAMLWCYFNHIDFALIMPRQFGKSVGADCLNLWLLFFGTRETTLFLFTKDADLRKVNIIRLKKIRDLLPPYLNPTSNKDADNTEVLTCVARGNILTTGIGQPAKDRADKVGRGFTVETIQVDEGPFIPNVDTSLKALLPAASKARENAQKSGAPYGTIYTTTAGKKDTREGGYMYSMIHSGMYFSESMLYDAKDMEDTWDIVQKNCSSAKRMINGTFSHRQLGKTDEWLAVTIAESGQENDKDASDRDFRNIWTSGSLSSPLSVQLNTAIADSEVDPLHITTSGENYIIKWYIPESEIEERMANGQFVLGLDTSNAVGRDANAMVLCDQSDMSVVATSEISEANLMKYGLWVAKLLIRFETITMIPENKASGQAIMDTIASELERVGICPFRRIFNRVADEYKSRDVEYSEISTPLSRRKTDVYTSYKKYLGFMTTGASRNFLYGTVFQEAANSTGHLVKDLSLSGQLKGLVMKNGKIDHVAGANDDLVIAWLLCHWMVRYSKNLGFYGIDGSRVLNMVSSDGAVLTEAEMVDKRKLLVVNERIEELKAQLQAAPSIMDRMRCEKVLSGLVREAQKLGETTYSMSRILEDVAASRVSKSNLRSSIRKLQARRGQQDPFKLAA